MSVSNKFKSITKKIKQQNIKLSICDGELTVKEIHMMPVHIFNALPVWKLRKQKKVIAKELKYSFDGQLFKTIMKQVEITVKNANEIKDKDINFQYGLFINNKFEYIDLGNYFIKDIEDSKKKDEITVTGYDRMIRFMKTFKQSELQLTYPCKMLKLVQKMCEVCGVELYSTDFYNADLDVEEDFFTAQELTYRDVLEKIAQTTLTTAFIEDNKLNLYKVSDDAIEKIDKSYLTDLTIKEKFGPANVLVLGRGDVEDNIEETDEKSIKQNGRCEIRFDENEFIEFQRKKVIKGMFEQIKGLEYYSFEASDVGVMWLKPCACIELGDKEDSLYKSYYLKANVTINTGISSDIEAELPEETNTEYKVTTKEEKKTLKVERLAKKNEGLIQDLVEETSENTEKLSQHEQTIDSMKDTLKSQETKIETVESKADTATTKANNAQTSANNAQSTANTANTNAQNAQKTADANTTKITTNTTKIAEVEKTVDGITQSVSEVKTKIKTVDGKADKAQSTANTAKSTADSTNKNLSNNYYTKTETNAQIQTKAESITTSVTKQISTAKQEAIDSSNSSTDEKLLDYTVTEKLGTFIEQNWEYIKYAWNQISQYLKLEGTDGKATLNIYDENNNILLSLNQDGESFYNEDKKIGRMGVIRNSDDKDELIIGAELIDRDSGGVESNSIISFGSFDNNGNFFEAFRIEGIYGYTDFKWTSYITTNHLTATSLTALQEIIAKNSIVFGASLASGDDTGEIYTEPIDSTGNRAYIILKSTDGVKIKTDKYTGYVMHGIAEGHTYKCNWTGSQLQFWVDTTNVGTLSDKRLKTDIQDIDEDFIKAIEEIEMKQFKVANRNGLISFGILAQDLIEIFEKYNKNPFDYEIVQETQYKIDDETIYYTINYEQFLILKQKAMDKKLEQLQSKDKQKDELIQSLIQRIETLEKEVNR